MARAPDKRIEQAKEMYLQGQKLVEIASQLNLPEGTVRRWKCTHKWDSERSDTKSERSDRKEKQKREHKARQVAEDVTAVEGSELNEKQRLFCLYYVRSFNATKAYQKAYGCDYESAAAVSYRLLDNVGVRKEIQRLKQARLNRELLDEHDIFQKYMDIAFADITDYLEFGTEEVPVMALYGPVKIKDQDTGKEKTLTKIVNTVRFKPSADVDGTILAEVKQGRDGASIKLADRMRALDWLAAHMDLATEEQRARIAQIKAQTERLSAQPVENEDDGVEIINDADRESSEKTIGEATEETG